MSHFYGILNGSRGEATRCGTKASGYRARAAGWNGCIETHLWYDEDRECDMFCVRLVPWGERGGPCQVLAEGRLDAQADASTWGYKVVA